jgi:hypothetical protein
VIAFGAIWFDIEPIEDGYFEVRRRLIADLLAKAGR